MGVKNPMRVFTRQVQRVIQLVRATPCRCNGDSMWRRLRILERELASFDVRLRDAFNRGNQAAVAVSRIKSSLDKGLPSQTTEVADASGSDQQQTPATNGVHRRPSAGVSMRRRMGR